MGMVEIKTFKRAKRRLFLFRLTVVLAILAATASIGAFATRGFLEDQFYTEYLMQAKNETGQSRRHLYEKAITCSPGRPEAYMQLLDTCAADGVFTNEESEYFFSLYNANRTKLRTGSDGHTLLQRTIALLYMNSFEANGATRLRMALPYLEAACATTSTKDPNYPLLECYSSIGNLYSTTIWQMGAQVPVTADDMAQRISQIRKAISAFVSDTSASAGSNSLGFGLVVCNFLYDFREYLPDTVSEETVTEFLDWVYKTLPQISALESEKNKELLTYLHDNENTFRDMIQWEYEKKGGEPNA